MKQRWETGPHAKLFRAVIARVLTHESEWQRFAHSTSLRIDDGPVDYHFAGPGDLRMPDQVFDRLRWGGQFVFVSTDPDDVNFTAKPFHARQEFIVECEPTHFTDGPPIPGLRKDYWYFIARKTHLIHVGEFSNRFTYDVRLEPHPIAEGDYVVRKRVPTVEMMERRLNLRHPNLDMDDIRKRAMSFTNKIFPMFLTREVGILKVVEKYLPEDLRGSFPRVIDLKKNERGYVSNFSMTWLRNGSGGKPITQVEFCKQACHLLRDLHDTVNVIHLDLRPDNMVITERGVGFIDLGSSVRVGEDLSRSKMLMKMFEQVMISSGIQKVLGQMCDSGLVTSRYIRNGYRKVDKAVDLFFLMLQMTKPLSNPDFKGLVQFDPAGESSLLVNALAARVLKPKDPNHPEYQTAQQVYQSLLDIERHLKAKSEEDE